VGQGDNELDALFRQNNNWAGVSVPGPTLRPNMSATTADQLLADTGMNRVSRAGGVQYADASSLMNRDIASDAGNAENVVFKGTLSTIAIDAEHDERSDLSAGDDWPSTERADSSDVQTPPGWSTLGPLDAAGRPASPYNPNWQADRVRNVLRDSISEQTARNTPGLRAWDPRTDGVIEAKNRALVNYVNGQGTQALGGVGASVTMLASGNVRTASMATDIAAPIDSLVAPMGGGRTSRLASGVHKPSGPRLIPNETLEAELIRRGNTSRSRIVEEIGKAAQPAIDALMRLDPKAKVGFRGSLSSGLKGEHKIDANGNRVAFDGEVAFKQNRAGQYEPYNGLQGYDIDFLVVSDKLAAQVGNNSFVKIGNAARLDPSLRGVLENFDAQLRSNPTLSGMKPGAPEFRVWSQKAIGSASGAPPTYFPLGDAR
jgi:hypothetical protein